MKKTWTVGLIHKDSVRTHQYDSFEEARKELKEWEKIYRLNNVVEKSTTLTVRDDVNSVTEVIITFYLRTKWEKAQMFLCKND